jgi:predicted MFS family arabinose efflux permease
VTRGLRLLFAIAAGAAVGNLYYVQPLLDVIGQDLNASHRAAGLLVTATQVGYAVGILMIVPLGDLRDRRRLVTVMMTLSALALLVCGLAPGVVTLTVALAALGVTTVSGQILIPLAGDLSDDASRGRTVGVVVSGVITGILVSRTLSGLLADWLGWRLVFVFAAAATLVLATLLRPAIPRLPAKTSGAYLPLLRSVFSLVASERTLRVTMVFGATAMAIFTMFWTALTFLLSGAPYHYSPSVIGLFGIVGLVGSLAAQGAGRLHDRGWSVGATGAAWLLAVLAWVVAGVGRDVLVLIVVAVVVLDVGVQGQNLLSQSRIFTLSAEARSRLNTAFVCGNFVGGALGSVAATLLWSAAGWSAVSTAGAGLALFGVVLWLGTRRGALRPQQTVEVPTG